ESYDVIGLSNEVIEVYCNLYDELKRRGKVIPDADLLIASTAMAHNLTLKTRDKHFMELQDLGLKLELME
ncbi:MAG: PIN domain-containing protein, partial [Candidatus Nezhaarchaeales archaeon]